AAKSDAEHYRTERAREQSEVHEKAEVEADEVTKVLGAYGVTPDESRPVVDALRRQPEAWVDFMMRFELGLEKPEPGRALKSAVTIAVAYLMGGLLPLVPYIALPRAATAFPVSAGVTLLALAVFGYVKGRFT